MIDDLGIKEDSATDRADEELRRKIPVAVIKFLSDAGIRVAGSDVLDLGAGLGGMSEELLTRGARVTALEPGAAWANLARRRAARHNGQFGLIDAFGESIPLPAESVDLIISLQVLEHVREPNKVLAEAWRVLRPGGYFFLACENYLAFREGHYGVPWFPLLPKPVAGLYLRLLGRSPRFLNEAVTYTTYPGVLRACRRLGFIRPRDEEVASGLRLKSGLKGTVVRVLDCLTRGRGPMLIDTARNMFKFGIHELFHKPLR